MTTHIIETKETKQPQNTTLADFILRAEMLVAEARRLKIPVVVGVDTPTKIHITANTTLDTSDDLFLLITGLAARQHPSILTLSQLDDKMRRLEEDTEDLRASGVPFVVGIQPESQGKLRILSHMPETTRLPIRSAHFDLTIDPTMLDDIQETPCS